MILIKKSIYYKYSRTNIYYIKDQIVIIILKNKGYKIKLIFNILYNNIFITKVYIILSKKLFFTDYN